MSISASQIVNVVPGVISAGGTDLEVTGLLLTKNSLCPFPNVLEFSNSDAVGVYFGTLSNEYLAAKKYFLGYDGSTRKPRKLSFAKLVDEAIAGFLIGGSVGTIEEIKTVTAGSFTINVDDSPVSVTDLDLSTISTQSDVATALTSKISGVSIIYNSNLNAFVITSETTGATSAVSVATDGAQTPAKILGLTADSGATESKGSPALSPNENMQSVTSVSQSWVSFTTMEEQEDDVIEGFAQWVSGTNCEYLYCPYTTKENNTNPNAGTNLPKTLANNNYEGVLLTFGGLDYAVFALSIGACINWDATNGLITYAFKSQAGLEPSVTDNITANNLLSLKMNYYGKWATRNDDFIYYYQGELIGGDFGFVDAYIGNLWLRNAIQVSIMNGLAQVGRVPYNDEGYTTISAWCIDPINRALNNGTIDTGVVLSESQKAALISEIGSDVSDQIMTDGYYLTVSDPGAQARVNRDTPVVGLWYTYGGSVHRLDVPVRAIL